jgi:hypothetical protein
MPTARVTQVDRLPGDRAVALIETVDGEVALLVSRLDVTEKAATELTELLQGLIDGRPPAAALSAN